MNQEVVFQQSEADRWFERNQLVLRVEGLEERDPVLRVLGGTGVRPTNALEVGAANGYRLEALRQQTGCRAVAVEPSGRAVADGRRRFPGVRFEQRLAHELFDFKDGEFDLAVASFVLHWVERSRLLETA